MNIAFLGDSVTQGCFEIMKNEKGEWSLVIEPQYSYVRLLSEKIQEAHPERDINFINAGISGDSTHDALNRIQKDVLAYEPTLTIVCLGLNNSGRHNFEEFSRELGEIITKLKQAGSKVIFMTPNMLNTYVAPGTPDYLTDMAQHCAELQNGGEMDGLMALGKETAIRNGALVCDVYAEWKRLGRYGIDTTALLCNHINHPTRGMHRLFADMLFDMLEQGGYFL